MKSLAIIGPQDIATSQDRACIELYFGPESAKRGAPRVIKVSASRRDLSEIVHDILTHFPLGIEESKAHLPALPSAEAFAAQSRDRAEEVLRGDIEDEGQAVAEGARLAAKRLLSEISPFVAAVPGITYAGFAEENGGVSIVFHSRPEKRQFTIEVEADGGLHAAAKIDEDMKSTRVVLEGGGIAQIVALLGWLRGDDDSVSAGESVSPSYRIRESA